MGMNGLAIEAAIAFIFFITVVAAMRNILAALLMPTPSQTSLLIFFASFAIKPMCAVFLPARAPAFLAAIFTFHR
jgi:hypothetical protein